MKVTGITVSASRTFNHPFEQYSNLKPGVVLQASLDESEDPEAAVRELQAKAERMVEDHKQALLRSIGELEELRGMRREVTTLEHQLKSAQSRMDEIRAKHPELLAELPESTSQDQAGTV